MASNIARANNAVQYGSADPSRYRSFKETEASRPDWRADAKAEYTKPQGPDWKYGDGASDGGESLKKDHRQIDPYEEGRPSVWNYQLLISAIVPRPIGFVSTLTKDGIYQISPADRYKLDRGLTDDRICGQSCALQLLPNHDT